MVVSNKKRNKDGKVQMNINKMKIYHCHSPKWKVDVFVVKNLAANHHNVDRGIKYQGDNVHTTNSIYVG